MFGRGDEIAGLIEFHIGVPFEERAALFAPLTLG
jgi:hypothetical protein